MQFVRVHPGFLAFFLLSLVTMIGAIVVAATATDACAITGEEKPSADCAVQAQGQETIALVIAAGGVAAMLAGVGFQVGRAGSTFQAAGPPYPPQQSR